MTTVFIKGLGLIGSSLVRAIRKQHPAYKIIGCDTEKETCSYALEHKLVDHITADLIGAQTADFIILATPVDEIIKDLRQLANMPLKRDVIVTDVGSTKQKVLKAALPLQNKGITFIGGHPMAGSHKTGVTAGRADLFENAFYFMIKTNAADPAYLQLQELLQATKVKWLLISAEEHDQLVGQISHLPHVIAAALVNQTQNFFADSPLGMRMAAGGFKSITRIASSDPTMWSSILQSNSAIIVQQLERYINELNKIEQAIVQNDHEQIFSFFESAKHSRDKLGPKKLGQLPDFFDLFINIPDRIGSIASITQLLAFNKISLVNIHILEIREDIDGVLQLTFMREEDRLKAEKLLTQKNYVVLRRD
ncbi:prephenate dehydrogenase [Liquorilactobacillus sucicola DSM 21376 = JCM 15457]|uniref:Prephenate dehydrogenase n=1 Tax=Liquorilactobacillus sucicola DSM 21376 = JCM 15457 TaxID=1423806 RepID=A0A023CY37_9LACO|nr:prephenate dehydrogenase [Liquorilactobacillus sucicola]KRN06954.1 prephenate dehydrogenase [Liquorilactobacillus sucicola DSM 21376 = JCM 15457]GAJ26435.1 prephenate dehydrogenase [Liquorilactobacillus sucicola DSM 21376 = JCM 15457]